MNLVQSAFCSTPQGERRVKAPHSNSRLLLASHLFVSHRQSSPNNQPAIAVDALNACHRDIEVD